MNFGDRWDCHRAQLNGGYHDNPHLQAAWNKYGSDNFEFAVVELCDDPERLNDLEIKYIAECKQTGLCYNISDGGDGGMLLGKHLSEETKRKIGEKNRQNMLGRKLSDETRQKMSQSQIKRFESWTDEDRKEWGQKMSLATRGCKWSKEAREKFSKIQQEHPNGAKYTADDIRAIRRKRANGAKLTELAEEYHTTPTYISTIVHRRRWANI